MKHKKSTTTFFLLFMMLNTLLYSQDYAEYYSLTSTAYTHYVQKEYNEAIDKFKTAFDKFYPFFNDVETMKKCYLAIGDKEGAYQAQCDMVLCGYKIDDTMPIIYPEISEVVLYNHNDINLGDTLLEQKFLEEYPKLRAQYERHIDPELNKYVEACIYFEVYSRIVRTQITTKSLKTYRLIRDAGFNAEKTIFMNLMREKDVPRFHVSAWECFNISIMLVHTTQSTTKEEFDDFFQLLWKQVQKGNVYLGDYAVCFDHQYALWCKLKKSYYGIQFERRKDGKHYILPVDDVEHIDERRAEIGLRPLWVWCKQYNLVPPTGYTMPTE